MKRGLIFWDKDAWPKEEFFLRVERLKVAMRTVKLDAAVIYGDANQSGDLAYLTHFFPYADTGIFILPLNSPPRLLTTHANRNMAWFSTITWVEDIICTNFIGQDCAAFLASMDKPLFRIGFVSARAFPYPIFEAIQKRLGCDFVDFTGIYEDLRTIKSERELSYIRKAADIAMRSFRNLSGILHPGISGFDIAAELERNVRLQGAEDLFCLIQPDGSLQGLAWPNSTRIRRYFSVEIAVEYNGYWSKLGRTMALDSSFEPVQRGLDRFSEVYLQSLNDWPVGQSARSFFRKLKSRLQELGQYRDVLFQIDFGLGPYWETPFLKNRHIEIPIKNQMALYLQVSLPIADDLRFLRSDTIEVHRSKPAFLTLS
jgi:Xaa-Pro aminopeptidase